MLNFASVSLDHKWPWIVNMEKMSVAEALQYLKAEILAQDWRLSPRRIETLTRAFAAIDREAAGRRALIQMLGMARATLEYIDRHGNAILPGVFDFQKESLAHLVNLLEDQDLTAARQAEICQLAYERFESLKRKLASGGRD
jgi:hypothetical protein